MKVSELIAQLQEFPAEAELFFWNSDQRGSIHGMELAPHKIVETSPEGRNLLEGCEESEKDLDVLEIQMYFAVEECDEFEHPYTPD